MQVILKAIDHWEMPPTLRRVRRIITISETMKKVYEATSGEGGRERDGEEEKEAWGQGVIIETWCKLSAVSMSARPCYIWQYNQSRTVL